jgi:hypothetical protein
VHSSSTTNSDGTLANTGPSGIIWSAICALALLVIGELGRRWTLRGVR